MYQYTGSRHSTLCVVAAFLVAATVVSNAGFAGEPGGPTIEVLAVTGDLTPDGADAYEFTSNWITLSDSGEVAFAVDFVGPQGTDGMFRGASSRLIQVARSGQDDGAGQILDDMLLSGDPYPAANASGMIAFRARTDSENSNNNDDAIYIGDGCTLTRVVLDGDPAPGDGYIYPTLSLAVSLNATGQVSFSALLEDTLGGGEDDQALYRWDGLGLPLVEIVRKGNEAPGGAGTLTGQALQSREMNDAGQVAFIADIDGSGLNGDSGIYRGDGGPLTEIARIGGLAPGGGTYARFGPASTVPINNAGQVAFKANLDTDESGSHSGIFRSDGISTVEIARRGNPVPDGDGLFRSSSRHVDLNENGQVAFLSSITGPANPASDEGLFIGAGTSRTLAARRMQEAPGGGVLGYFDSFSINDASQLAFSAGIDLDTTDNNLADEYGIFMFDPNSGLHLVARTGMSFMGTTIYDLEYAGTSSSNGSVPLERSGFNNAGEVAFLFQLTDHSGLKGVAVWRKPRDPADFDGNGTVALSDATVMLGCMSGPGVPAAACCRDKDLDGDDDVDLADFALLQERF